MALNERILEENEVRIDNILHKILICAKHIGEISDSFENFAINEDSESLIRERIEKIKLLSEVIEKLTSLADEMDLDDEIITKELEEKVSDGINYAIEVLKKKKQKK